MFPRHDADENHFLKFQLGMKVKDASVSFPPRATSGWEGDFHQHRSGNSYVSVPYTIPKWAPPTLLP